MLTMTQDVTQQRTKTKTSRGKQLVLDYLCFRQMISPILLQILFWAGIGILLFVRGVMSCSAVGF